MNVTIRRATAEDAKACGTICFNAFAEMNHGHGFSLEFPPVEIAQMAIGFSIQHPQLYGVVAEADGKIVGSNFLDERDPVRGIGPITVDPAMQKQGVGRRLMEAVLERARGSASVRLVQEAFNLTSMSLYTSLGFDIKEPLVYLKGKPKSLPTSGIEIKPAKSEYREQCAALCKQVHGFDRANELRDAAFQRMSFVAMREGRVTAYVSNPTSFVGHGVAESDEDLQAVLLGAAAATGQPLGFLLPSRNANMFRWALTEGLRGNRPMTLMSIGEYQPPRGSWFSSIQY